MADKKISQLTAASTPLDGTEVLPIVQSGSTVKVANNDLRPKQIQSNATSGVMQIVGPAAATTRVMTTPNANFTAARTDAAQTFTGDQTFNNTVVVKEASEYPTAGAGVKVIRQSSSDYWSSYVAADGNLSFFSSVFNDRPFYIGTDANLYPTTAAKGINFTANTGAAGMTSQLLNWYEEGTFTPAFTGDTTNPTITYSSRNGKYTRIGNTVFFGVQITVNTTSGGSGNLRVTGLPFTCNATVAGGATRLFVYDWNTNPKTYVVPQSSNTLLIYLDDGTNSVASPTDLKNGCYFNVFGTYLV